MQLRMSFSLVFMDSDYRHFNATGKGDGSWFVKKCHNTSLAKDSAPWFEATHFTLMATWIPSARRPWYTGPNLPWPRRSLKWLVARSSSFKENCLAFLCRTSVSALLVSTAHEGFLIKLHVEIKKHLKQNSNHRWKNMQQVVLSPC